MNGKDKLKEYYHVDANGNIIPFCTLLNCFDQICYFEFRKVSKFNHWIYFCDDINLAIDDQGDPFVMGGAIHDKYQTIESWVIKDNHFDEISSLLRQKDSVMISTAFNYVCNYDWWRVGKGYLHTGHLSYLVGEDYDNYYIADNPDIFLNVESIQQKFNPSIFKIPKENFAEAFQKYCCIYNIIFHDLPTEKEEYPFLKEVITNITENYFINADVLCGRKALEYLKKKCSLREREMFNSCFIFHIMVSRRLLLKKSVGIVSKQSTYHNEIIKHIDLSINYWTKIKELAYAYVKEGKEICELVEEILPPLIENEDILMEYLREIGKNV